MTKLLVVAILGGFSWSVEAQTPAAATEKIPQLQQVQSWADECAKECAAVMEGWIAAGDISKQKLFSYLYYPLPNTTPPKFSTDYDTRSDKDIQAILEQYLSKGSELVYVVMVDKNGYVPTHNLKFSVTLTGDRAKDYKQNLTKRILNDKIGLAAARNQAPHLLQGATDGEGQAIMDLAVPLIIDKKQWGAIRIGFKPAAPAAPED